jgi:hypothetical protein
MQECLLGFTHQILANKYFLQLINQSVKPLPWQTWPFTSKELSDHSVAHHLWANSLTEGPSTEMFQGYGQWQVSASAATILDVPSSKQSKQPAPDSFEPSI